jgi:hypothetical protein
MTPVTQSVYSISEKETETSKRDMNATPQPIVGTLVASLRDLLLGETVVIVSLGFVSKTLGFSRSSSPRQLTQQKRLSS